MLPHLKTIFVFVWIVRSFVVQKCLFSSNNVSLWGHSCCSSFASANRKEMFFLGTANRISNHKLSLYKTKMFNLETISIFYLTNHIPRLLTPPFGSSILSSILRFSVFIFPHGCSHRRGHSFVSGPRSLCTPGLPISTDAPSKPLGSTGLSRRPRRLRPGRHSAPERRAEPRPLRRLRGAGRRSGGLSAGCDRWGWEAGGGLCQDGLLGEVNMVFVFVAICCSNKDVVCMSEWSLLALRWRMVAVKP